MSNKTMWDYINDEFARAADVDRLQLQKFGTMASLFLEREKQKNDMLMNQMQQQNMLFNSILQAETGMGQAGLAHERGMAEHERLSLSDEQTHQRGMEQIGLQERSLRSGEEAQQLEKIRAAREAENTLRELYERRNDTEHAKKEWRRVKQQLLIKDDDSWESVQGWIGTVSGQVWDPETKTYITAAMGLPQLLSGLDKEPDKVETDPWVHTTASPGKGTVFSPDTPRDVLERWARENPELARNAKIRQTGFGGIP